jgi:hypothetical protein
MDDFTLNKLATNTYSTYFLCRRQKVSNRINSLFYIESRSLLKYLVFFFGKSHLSEITAFVLRFRIHIS